MVKRFNGLENKMLVSPDKATTITRAICVLHNVSLTREANIAEIQNEIENNQEHTEIRNSIKITLLIIIDLLWQLLMYEINLWTTSIQNMAQFIGKTNS